MARVVVPRVFDPKPPHTVNDLCRECAVKALAIFDWVALMSRRDHARRFGYPYKEPTTRPEDALREAGVSTKRQARYQRRMSSLLAGRTR
jgi:hypothetical protein